MYLLYFFSAGSDVAPALAETYAAGNKVLLCRFCNMEFDRRANLVEHVADWCGNLSKPFTPSDVYASSVRTLVNESRAPDDESPANAPTNVSFSFDFEGDGKTYK